MSVVVAVLTLGAGCGSPEPEAERNPNSWLVLLCKASDAPTEPHGTQFYKQFFSRSERDLLYDYFDAASGGGAVDEFGHKIRGTVDVSGSEVYGWFEMGVDTATLQTRRNGAPVDRTQTARDCLASARPHNDPAGYAGVITVINVPVDSGATGDKSVVVNNPESSAAGPAFLEHEMLHVLGLRGSALPTGHSWLTSEDFYLDHRWAHGGDQEYQDCWDMMSFYSCTYKFATSVGPQGPELQGEYRLKLGWLGSSRVDVLRASAFGLPRRVVLAPVSDPSKPGFLLARIEVPGRGYYAVEYRETSRFDRAIPVNAVVIREVRPNGVTYLVRRFDGRIDWRKGEIFTDKQNDLAISMDDISPGKAVITINSGPVSIGSWCGHVDHGQVLHCNTGACGRRPGSLSKDLFCRLP